MHFGFFVACAPAILALGSCATQHGGSGAAAVPPAAVADWRTAEAPVLTNHTQLTFADKFLKAGEAYFSPDDSRIIFQAIEVPPAGTEVPDFYAMYVADVKRDGAGRITGIANTKRLSPAGSANTCGWFDPRDSNVVYFGCTLTPPSNKETPGYQRGSGRYRWQFPPEMRIVKADLRTADGTAAKLQTIVGDGSAYTAEGSVSPDGKTLLYTQMDPKTEGDLWIRDLATGQATKLISEPGYDGGPFFNADATRIIYRSDRRNDNLLQVFTADVVRDPSGAIVGVANERAMTNNEHVNWCPYFHKDGHHFVYATSQAGHTNYEVFMRDEHSPKKLARITMGQGADVLPVFNSGGTVMMWTAQRGNETDAKKSSQIWVADFNLAEAVKRMAPE